DLAADAADERHRYEYRGQNEGDGNHRRRHFLHGAHGRIARRHAVVDVALHGFHDYDRVVDYDADGQHQPEHAGDVDRKAEERKQRKCSHYGYGYGQQRDQSRAPVLQENEYHQNYQADGFEQRPQHVRDGFAHEHRGVVRDLVADALRKRALDLLHVPDHLV